MSGLRPVDRCGWRIAGRAASLVLACCLGAADARAQRFPARCYDETAGLSQNRVSVAVQDHKGYLWIGTGEGLSRFDGYRFVTYGASQGLPHLYINHLAVDRLGRLWIATNGGGLARL